MSTFNSKASMENQSLLLQSLMGRMQIRPPYLHTNSFLSQSLDDFLASDLSKPFPLSSDDESEKTELAKEESKLEKEIIRLILTGKSDTLKPNSGQAVTIGEHHICVGFHEEKGSNYRVWEWHGHIMLLDEESGYSPEYIYGNYFERVEEDRRIRGEGRGKGEEDEEEEAEEEEKDDGVDVGLRALISDGDSPNARILSRNLTVGSPK